MACRQTSLSLRRNDRTPRVGSGELSDRGQINLRAVSKLAQLDESRRLGRDSFFRREPRLLRRCWSAARGDRKCQFSRRNSGESVDRCSVGNGCARASGGGGAIAVFLLSEPRIARLERWPSRLMLNALRERNCCSHCCHSLTKSERRSSFLSVRRAMVGARAGVY